MLDLFLNPYSMMAGLALTSSPIIIHLINRLRFKRVRWAAMEFLLKSQKRNQRRVYLEQLLLLLLRILLVLLIGLLMGRYLGFNLTVQQQDTVHVILVDDTLSMSDFQRADGASLTAFSQAQRYIVDDIAVAASQATTAQSLVIIPMSQPDAPRLFERLNAASIDEVRGYLNGLTPTPLHVPLLGAVQRAKAEADTYSKAKRLLHVVSDFRAVDWKGGDSEELAKLFEECKRTGTQVHLLDVAQPVRSATQRVALYHDNLGIVDLQPETLIVARYMPVEFTAVVANYSNSEKKNVRVTVKVNGNERAEGSFTLPSIPANDSATATFAVAFDRIATDKTPLERFSIVSATLENEEAGLAQDNTRFAVVEVRERVPMLVIEGDPTTRGKKDGDSFYLQKFFAETAKGYDFLSKPLTELEQPGLERYPAIWLLNVPRLSEKAVKALETYVRQGGGLAIFMGPECKPDFYNQLYADGAGLFPVPLPDKPTEPLTDDQKLERRLDPGYKLFVRDYNHMLFNRLYRGSKNREEYDLFLRFIVIDRYFPVPRLRWKQTPAVAELLTLPNYRQMSDYADTAQQLIKQLPLEVAEFAKYRAALDGHRRRIIDTIAVGGALSGLASALDALLRDTGDPKDPAKPNLQELWQQPSMLDLRTQLRSFLDTVRYGDPYLVGKQVGKGKVTVCLSTAGTLWNNWPDGTGTPYFVPLVLEMQKYLSSSTSESNLTLGRPFEITADGSRFAAGLRRYTLIDIPARAVAVDEATPKGVRDLGEQQPTSATDDRLSFTFADGKTPGVYVFGLTPKPSNDAAADKPQAEYLARAFNVDTLAESDLARVGRDELEQKAPGAQLHLPGSEWSGMLKERPRDLSESPWMFLLLLAILVAEQALAVRLSYHNTGADAAPVSTERRS